MVLLSVFKIEMKLNKGTIPVTINLIYLGRSKSVRQLKVPYTKNILLVVKTFSYVYFSQCRKDGLSPSILIGISFYIHFRQLTLMGLFKRLTLTCLLLVDDTKQSSLFLRFVLL